MDPIIISTHAPRDYVLSANNTAFSGQLSALFIRAPIKLQAESLFASRV